jgi:hypothetical protein
MYILKIQTRRAILEMNRISYEYMPSIRGQRLEQSSCNIPSQGTWVRQPTSGGGIGFNFKGDP